MVRKGFVLIFFFFLDKEAAGEDCGLATRLQVTTGLSLSSTAFEKLLKVHECLGMVLALWLSHASI